MSRWPAVCSFMRFFVPRGKIRAIYFCPLDTFDRWQTQSIKGVRFHRMAALILRIRLAHIILFLTFSCLFFAAPARVSAATPHLAWQPAHIWVFVVGLQQWQHKNYFESFPQEGRRDVDLVQLFRTAGVPSTHIVYLQDRQAT